MKRILIATDGSETSRRAVKEGLILAAAVGAQVTLTTVVHDSPPTFGGEPGAPSSPAMQIINDALRDAADRGVPSEYQIVAGDAAEEIARLADSLDVDLIVLGSRGLGTVRGALLGSVSHGVLNHTHCSVLVVRDRSR